MEVLKLESVNKSYDDKKVICNLNMSLRKGEIYGFLGNNGAGKSTTMKMILGLSKLDSGLIEILGESSIKRKSVLKRVGSNIEFPGFYKNLTAYENLSIISELYNITNKMRINEVLELCGLGTDDNKLVSKFSLGMKQRLGIARTLLNNPELLILDEPINGLDPHGIIEMRKLFKYLSKDCGITLMISSHILPEIEQISDRIGILHKGVLVEEIDLTHFYGQENSYIELIVNNPKKAESILSKTLGIVVNKSGEQLIIRKYHESIAEINKTLVKEGVEVTHLIKKSSSLESHFVHLTGEENLKCIS